MMGLVARGSSWCKLGFGPEVGLVVFEVLMIEQHASDLYLDTNSFHLYWNHGPNRNAASLPFANHQSTADSEFGH